MRSIFFDIGGTLIRPRGSAGAIYAKSAARFAVRLDAAGVDRRFREAFNAAPPLAFLGAKGKDLLMREQDWWRRVVRAAVAGHNFNDFEAFFQTLYRDFAEPDVWEVFADVVPVLDELRIRGFSLGVISNFDQRLVPLLRGLELERFFDSVTFSSAAGFAKPDERIFTRALRQHSVAAADAIHVGDSQREDVDAALAVGMKAVLVRADGGGLERVLREVPPRALR